MSKPTWFSAYGFDRAGFLVTGGTGKPQRFQDGDRLWV
jgi:hypothetical protein